MAIDDRLDETCNGNSVVRAFVLNTSVLGFLAVPSAVVLYISIYYYLLV